MVKINKSNVEFDCVVVSGICGSYAVVEMNERIKDNWVSYDEDDEILCEELRLVMEDISMDGPDEWICGVLSASEDDINTTGVYKITGDALFLYDEAGEYSNVRVKKLEVNYND